MTLCLTGCWDSHELNQLAFQTALGIDKSSNNEFIVTIQILNSRAIASQKSTNEAPIVVFTDEGYNLLETIRSMNTRSPRRITGTHLQTIVFGEEFARSGISEVVDFLLRDYQHSPDLYCTVAKGTTANNLLSSLTNLENNPSVKISSSLQISEKAWAATKTTKITELVNSIVASGINPVLTGIKMTDSAKQSVDDLKLTKTDPLQLSDIAVFQRDKLVGWLNEDECKGFNYITGNVLHSAGYIESQETGKITLDITSANSKQKMVIKNKKPAIIVNLQVVAKIETVSSDFDVTTMENIKKIEKLARDKLISLCESSINKAKSLKSDIFGFGEVIHRTDPKTWKSIKDNWNDDFVSLPVSINVDYKITGTDSIAKSFISERE